jgi:hypothetical protein
MNICVIAHFFEIVDKFGKQNCFGTVDAFQIYRRNCIDGKGRKERIVLEWAHSF